MDGNIAIIDLFFLLIYFPFEFLDEFEGVTSCLLLLILVDEVVVLLFDDGLLGLDHREAQG